MFWFDGPKEKKMDAGHRISFSWLNGNGEATRFAFVDTVEAYYDQNYRAYALPIHYDVENDAGAYRARVQFDPMEMYDEGRGELAVVCHLDPRFVASAEVRAMRVQFDARATDIPLPEGEEMNSRANDYNLRCRREADGRVQVIHVVTSITHEEALAQ